MEKNKKLYLMPDHVPDNIKTLLGRLSYSGDNDFHEIQVLREILACVSTPLSLEEIEKYLNAAAQRADE